MNTFGKFLALSTFGESHGVGIGGVLDGMPAGVKIDMDFLQAQMDMRKPGGKYATNRKEDDALRILSGVFEDNGVLFSTGTPIGFVIENTSQHSKDYENIKNIFRPGHADYTYLAKYGLRDHRGGGRASARETAIRVAGGAFAALLLAEFGIKVHSGVISVGQIGSADEALNALASGKNDVNCDFDHALNSEIFALNPQLENAQKELISKLKDENSSLKESRKVMSEKDKTDTDALLNTIYDKKINPLEKNEDSEDDLDLEHQGKSVIALGDKATRAKIKEYRQMDSLDYCDCCGARMNLKPWDRELGVCHKCNEYYGKSFDRCKWRNKRLNETIN